MPYTISRYSRLMKAVRLPMAVVLLLLILPRPGSAQELEQYKSILWNHLKEVTAFGPRPPGSEALEKLRDYLRRAGKQYADEVREQPFTFTPPDGTAIPMVNIEFVFHGQTGKAPLLLGAHYDTRPFADEEANSDAQRFPITGANDGGSGTALLLGLARYLHTHKPERPVRLVFFDGEDYGVKFSPDYFLGSKHYAAQLQQASRTEWPYAVLILDMIADRDLKISRETYSAENAAWLLRIITQAAENQKAQAFLDPPKHTVRDDHLPFMELGIPAAVLIDFDYPYWHTLADTLDKCSPDSLFTVFSVVVEALSGI